MISFDELATHYPEENTSFFSNNRYNASITGQSCNIDRDYLRQKTFEPHEWHNSVLKLVASYVAKGNTDAEIHILTKPFTCEGNTAEKTRYEVQTMIDGARAKGFDSKVINAQPQQTSDTSEPLPLVPDFPPPQKFPIEALGALQKVVETVHKASQAPIEIAAASALSATSLIIQGHANVETLGGYKPLSLYMLTIARSGERKSSCDAPIIAAIKRYEKQQSKSMERTVMAFHNRQDIYRIERSKIMALLKRTKKPITREEAERQFELLGPEPTPPPSTDRLVTEPTYEGLTQMFRFGQPSLGLFSDEGGQFLGGYAMNKDNKQKTLAAFNDLWSGNSIRRTRQSDGAYQLFDRRLAIHLMVQPSVAHELLSDPLAVDTGFLARFLICEPETTIGTRKYNNSQLDQTSLDEFQKYQSYLLEQSMPINSETGGLEPRVLTLSPEAKAELIEYADEVERKQSKGNQYEPITGTASKSAEQAARLAGVLTVFSDITASHIDADTMRNAISLAHYYLDEALRLVEVAVASTELKTADYLLKWISQNYGIEPFLFSEVLQNGPNSVRDSKRLKSLFAILTEYGWLIKMPKATIVDGKSRNTAYRLAELASGS